MNVPPAKSDFGNFGRSGDHEARRSDRLGGFEVSQNAVLREHGVTDENATAPNLTVPEADQASDRP